MNEFFLIQLKADCCVIVFTAQAIEHILKFAQKKWGKKKTKEKKIKKVKDALKAAPVQTKKKNIKTQHALIEISKQIKLSPPKTLARLGCLSAKLSAKSKNAPAQRKCLFKHVFV